MPTPKSTKTVKTAKTAKTATKSPAATSSKVSKPSKLLSRSSATPTSRKSNTSTTSSAATTAMKTPPTGGSSNTNATTLKSTLSGALKGTAKGAAKGTLIGYARVSTHEQTLALQEDALQKAGCAKIFNDTISGGKWAKEERQGLAAALEYMREGDTLAVWRLDRLGRSLRHLIETVTMLAERGVGFKSLTESIDTTTSGGKLVFHVFGALAEFERDLIRERTKAGLEAARARGRQGGRPQQMDERKVKVLQSMYADKSNSIQDILSTLHISKSTLYRYVKPDLE